MKRFLDMALVLATFPLWGGLVLLVALVLLLTDGRPVLFRQMRAGLKGRPFAILKFRTMRPGPGTDMERLTRLGRFLRRTSLDELPQLVNILKGDMSLVGPRPLPVAYVARYAPEQARRLDVRPGLTDGRRSTDAMRCRGKRNSPTTPGTWITNPSRSIYASSSSRSPRSWVDEA